MADKIPRDPRAYDAYGNWVAPGNRGWVEWQRIERDWWYRRHPRERLRVFGPRGHRRSIRDTRDALHVHALRVRGARDAHSDLPRRQDYGTLEAPTYIADLGEFWRDHPDECRCACTYLPEWRCRTGDVTLETYPGWADRIVARLEDLHAELEADDE